MKRIVLLLTLMLVIVSGVAFIPTKHAAAESTCEAHPSDANCDGGDPFSLECVLIMVPPP